MKIVRSVSRFWAQTIDLLSKKILDRRTSAPKWLVSRIQSWIEAIFLALFVNFLTLETPKLTFGLIFLCLAAFSFFGTLFLKKHGLPLSGPKHSLLEKRLVNERIFHFAELISNGRFETIEIGHDLETNLLLDGNKILAKNPIHSNIIRMIKNRVKVRALSINKVDSGYVFYLPRKYYLNNSLSEYINETNKLIAEMFETFRESPWIYKQNNALYVENKNILIVALMLDEGLNEFVNIMGFTSANIYCLTLFIPAIFNGSTLSQENAHTNESCKRLFQTYSNIHEFVPLIEPSSIKREIKISLSKKVNFEV